MKRINSLSDLLMEELADLLNAENQLAAILPKMAQAAQLSALKAALAEHHEITKDHISRLQGIFSNIGQNPSYRVCKAVQGFIADIEDVVNDPERYPARDTAIIKVAQRAGNFEINGYAVARGHAADLGHTRMVELLDQSLSEERAINFHLNELAQGMINTQAIDPKGQDQQTNQQKEPVSEGGGFYIPEGKFGRGGIKKKPKNTEVSRFTSEGNPNTNGTS